jgi:hypothetical protein
VNFKRGRLSIGVAVGMTLTTGMRAQQTNASSGQLAQDQENTLKD